MNHQTYKNNITCWFANVVEYLFALPSNPSNVDFYIPCWYLGADISISRRGYKSTALCYPALATTAFPENGITNKIYNYIDTGTYSIHKSIFLSTNHHSDYFYSYSPQNLEAQSVLFNLNDPDYSYAEVVVVVRLALNDQESIPDHLFKTT